jgi:hypothetical protein
MKRVLIATAVAAIVFAPAAFAQTRNSPNQSGSQAIGGSTNNSSSTSGSSQDLAAAQKIKQDLQNAGFTDVNVVAESFVVQAKSRDGNPVVMTIGPHGMSVFEAMNASDTGSNSSSGATTGSSSSNSMGSSSSGSPGSSGSGAAGSRK